MNIRGELIKNYIKKLRDMKKALLYAKNNYQQNNNDQKFKKIIKK